MERSFCVRMDRARYSRLLHGCLCVGAICDRPLRCGSLAAMLMCEVVLSLSRESTKERPGATMEGVAPGPRCTSQVRLRASLRGATFTAGLAARAARHPMIATRRLG